MIIHTFGDSHSEFGWKNIGPCIVTHHIGPRLCYSFGRDKFREQFIEITTHAKERDIILFSFGEIDCRFHIHRYTHISESKIIIDDIIEKYFESIDENIKHRIKYGSNIIPMVYSIPPALQGHTNLIDSDVWGVNKVSDFYLGADEDRKQYHNYFNECLYKNCISRSIMFLDVSKEYSTQNGYLDLKYSTDGVHICDPVFIVEKLNTLFPKQEYTSSYLSSIR